MMRKDKITEISAATSERLSKFDRIRGNEHESEEFWDLVVVTAIDLAQKCSYELQLQLKMEQKELPLSAEYVVLSDPPGPKIGNGGSTLFVMDQLVNQYGIGVLDKKIIIVHAGGFSQRLPNASILGKVFLGTPVGEPMYQALELKLASYVDFPSKILGGGIFVCSADTIEVYTDKKIPWVFASEGFTALAHLSPVSIGKTHGVFVLDQPLSGSDILWDCKKFLHKPSFEEMLTTKNCVVHEDETKWVMTDSAFFISKNTSRKLLKFYRNNAPLTCEVDAYGDFLQALGKESSPKYTTNVQNVCEETSSLVETRQRIYNLLKDTPLHAVVLSHPPQWHPTPRTLSTIESPASIFYHLGTMPEYLYNFCKDEEFKAIFGVGLVTSCCGMPFFFNEAIGGIKYSGSSVKVSRKGALSCAIEQAKCCTPCIIGCVIKSNVSVGENTVVEYCLLGKNAVIGSNCIVSNCHVAASAQISDGVFMHTAAVCREGDTVYVTIVFEVGADLKKSMPTVEGLKCITYFGKALKSVVSTHPYDTISLWNAKLFSAARSMEQSCKQACRMLVELDDAKRSSSTDNDMFSVQDILKSKDLKSVLEFRRTLAELVKHEKLASYLF